VIIISKKEWFLKCVISNGNWHNYAHYTLQKCTERFNYYYRGSIKIITEPTKWDLGYVAINSFGFGGANSHILLKPNLKQKINNGAPNDNLPRLIVVSGRTEEAVKIILDNVSK